MKPDHSSSPMECPICSLVFCALGHPFPHSAWSAFLALLGAGWQLLVLEENDRQAYFGPSCLLRGFSKAL